MPDQKIKRRVVSSASQFRKPPPLREEEVILTELGADDEGYYQSVFQRELSSGEHYKYVMSNQVLGESGEVVRVDNTYGPDMHRLAWTTRDGDGNRLFHTVEEAAKVLNDWGKSITNRMMLASNKVNYEEAETPEEAARRAEGKSEETSTSS